MGLPLLPLPAADHLFPGRNSTCHLVPATVALLLWKERWPQKSVIKKSTGVALLPKTLRKSKFPGGYHC